MVNPSSFEFRKPFMLYVLIALQMLEGLTALVCGAALMYAPSGKPMMLPREVLNTSPFNNFFIPGFFLFTCLGVLPMLAAYGLMTRRDPQYLKMMNIYREYRVGWMLSLFCGFGTLIWISAQLYFTRTFHPLQTIYSAVGMAILVITLLPGTMKYCRQVLPAVGNG
jgi:hypothetical protein